MKKKISSFIQRGLKEEGYSVDIAGDGEDGLHKALSNPYDLIVLDIMLPKKDGIAVCRELKKGHIATPVLMLTARDSVEDKVTGLDSGADDYLTKPFAFEELLARARALLRRGSTIKETLLRVGDLSLDQLTREVKRGGKKIELTSKEYALLEYLMLNAGNVVTRTMISEHVWDEHFDTFTNIIDVYVKRLRSKIDKSAPVPLIQTLRGAGYVIRKRLAMKINSLHFKISLWYVLTLAVILIVFATLLYVSESYYLNSSLDSLLRIKAAEIRRNIEFQAELKTYSDDVLFSALQKMFYEDFYIKEIDKMWKQRVSELALSNDFIQISDAGGRVVGRSSNMAREDVFPLTKEQLEAALSQKTIIFSDSKRNLRVVAEVVEKDKQPRFIIQVGTSLVHIKDSLRKLLLLMAVFIPMVLIVTSFIGYSFVNRALKPVDGIASAARRITIENLNEKVGSADQDEEIQNLVMTFNDMLARLKKSLGHIMEFNSHVSHELRTPLSIMKGETEISLRRPRSAEEYQQTLRADLEEINRMYRIIDDLLLLAKLNYQKNIFHMQPLALDGFLTELIEQASVLAREKGLELKKAGEFPSVSISGDGTHLRRLFYNIFDNAVKFTPAGGSVTVRMALDSGRIRVSISDTGPGIPQEDLKRIFEPFYRASLGSEKIQGTGLGLSMARTIAEFHGGEILVESRENRGTTFFVDLPALPDHDQPSS